MLVDLWLLIDPGLSSQPWNELAKLALSTLYWIMVATLLTVIVTQLG